MKKRKLALVALGLCSVITVAGCGSETTSSVAGSQAASSQPAVSMPDVSGSSVDVLINYKKSESLSYGVSYTGSSAYSNPFDGKTYSNGDILPTWKAFGEALNVTIRDSADYSVHTDDNQFSQIYTTNDVKFKDVHGNMVDLWMNSEKNMNTVGANGELVNLLDYVDYMPNFKAWMDENQATVDQLTNDHGEMFVAPYFDGKDNIEKMIMMDTAMVEKLLDGNPTYDEADTLATTEYEAYLDLYNNEKIAVVGLDGKATTITVTQTESVITKQNNLSVKNGKTLTNALKEYLQATYGEYVGTGKLYSNLSEIYTSASACYNVDELVALMRCVKTNSQLLTGTTDKKVTVLSPREDKNSRTHNIIQFASVWGVSGLTAEKDYLYFDKDGNLCDARTTKKTYEVGLANLHKLYAEGLILENYNTKVTGKTNYAKTLIPEGQLFMEYDYNATSAQYNAVDDNGIGVSGSKTSGFRPVLSPVTYWDNDDHTTYKYTRYTEDNRAVKSGGWVIPTATDNLYGALYLMDYMYSEEGANLQDFGPEAYVDGTLTLTDGTTCPKIKSSVLKDISQGEAKDLGWNNWYRCYVGSTQGIGHVRNNGLDYQVTNASGQTGLDNVNKAISAGVFGLATTTGTGFKKSVPTFWSISAADSTRISENADYTFFTDFYKSAVDTYSGYHGAVRDGLSESQLSEIYSHFAGCDSVYLSTYKLYL